MKKPFVMFVLLVAFQVTIAQQRYTQTIHAQVPVEPTVFYSDGNQCAYYELHVTNFASKDLVLRELKVLTPTNKILFDAKGPDLHGRFSKVGFLREDSVVVLGAGMSGVIYIELVLAKDIPAKLIHEFHLTFPHDSIDQSLVIRGAELTFKKTSPVVIGPPLKEGIWAAVNNPKWERGHRRVIYTQDGKARIPGRYAIDFIRLDEHGKYAKLNEDTISNWYGYAADVLAVADGIVSSVNTSFSESPLVSSHPNVPAERATGNYVSIRIGENQIAYYEHLQPNSIRVKPGQSVKKGDIIASLGFTGQTTGPHLHFHMADVDSPLGAEGIPFVFERFTTLGYYDNFEKFGKSLWTERRQDIRVNERPGANTVIVFHKR